jgi:hypothetical protein
MVLALIGTTRVLLAVLGLTNHSTCVRIDKQSL